MYINKFSIVDFTPAHDIQTDAPKKRGRPPKNSPHANKSMFIRSTETMPMRYELTNRMTDQFKKDKRRRKEKKACNSPNTSNCSTYSSASSLTVMQELNNCLVSDTLVSSLPTTHASTSQSNIITTTSTTNDNTTTHLESNLITSNNNNTSNYKPPRKTRYSISIKELLN
ncbi:predicted protein [Naegleria gruberi]|uniref:Predicted protein n=1 Tax=Naegleria gruberi TaxID=5762 RepID=D2W3U3_NAEGR|nr:uncharacterized protein NAEGRDRAFT_76067 [Naegleria gruberi]EFC36232.1 predicted protein [Naegleria gruberi]|eukprot:XP_002668976.1 predicted protein [Naegleria gruberi strain NEG-M]